jgi:hypothetical protein
MVAILVLCAAATALEVSPENQLAAAEAKWAANKPKAYEFTFRLIACCVIPLTGPAAEPIVFRVEGGTPSLVSGVRAVTLKTGSPIGFDKYNTVENQFALIRAELATRPYRTEIEYEPDVGYPRRFYLKRFENAADDEYTFTVEGFRSLARK